jgi:hypothetical protein
MSLDGLNSDFSDVLIALADARADFIVVGAYAMALHGTPRSTGDIDIFVRPDAANAMRVYSALEAFGAPLESAGIAAADFAKEGLVYQIGLPPRRIDILTSISGVPFDEAASDVVEVQLNGRAIRFLGRAALIRNKKASGRPKDLVDVDVLAKRKPKK